MTDGFIKCAAVSVDVSVGCPSENKKRIVEAVLESKRNGIKLLCFGELCLTGYTCGDLFYSRALIDEAESALFDIARETAECDVLFVVGMPIRHYSKLYDCAVAVYMGEILGISVKRIIDADQKRIFESGESIAEYQFHRFSCGVEVTISNKLLLCCENIENYIVGVEIGEDISCASLCHSGAKIILNPTASPALVSYDDVRRTMLKAESRRSLCTIVSANASYTESTMDCVFSAHNIIVEMGRILAECEPLAENTIAFSDTDVDLISQQRMNNSSFCERGGAYFITFSQDAETCALDRKVEKNPFVPEDETELAKRCDAAFNLQVMGLVKRLKHTGIRKSVIGISGGLDSTLALLVCAGAFSVCGIDRENIITVTMPCFGTSERTKNNAVKLCESLGTSFCEINISKSVRAHFEDIGQDENVHDVTYENSQARERTQILMDLANKESALVIGTGDLSELALGFCTYNGDHMSNYAVNCDVPKTLVRKICTRRAEIAKNNGNTILSETLFDVVDTPVSPELLPPDEKGSIAQKTEDIVGPYELHDFFLYYTVRCAMRPHKIKRLACAAYEGIYDEETVEGWLRVFLRRFYSQQFKRSCMPDGVKIGSVSLSPRGDFRMPSDVSFADLGKL